MSAFKKFSSLLTACVHSNRVFVNVPFSNIVLAVVRIMQQEGLVSSFAIIVIPPAENVSVPVPKQLTGKKKKGRKCITVYPNYTSGHAILREIRCVSIPSRRCYAKLPALLKGLQYIDQLATREEKLLNLRFNRLILSTSQGIMTEHQAIKLRIGGEVLCKFNVS